MEIHFDLLYLVLIYLVPPNLESKHRISITWLREVVNCLSQEAPDLWIKKFLVVTFGIRYKKRKFEEREKREKNCNLICQDWPEYAVYFMYNFSQRNSILRIIDSIRQCPQQYRYFCKIWAYKMLLKKDTCDKEAIFRDLTEKINRWGNPTRRNETFSQFLKSEIDDQEYEMANHILVHISQPIYYVEQDYNENVICLMEKMTPHIELYKTFVRKILVPMIDRKDFDFELETEDIFLHGSQVFVDLWIDTFLSFGVSEKCRNQRLKYWSQHGSVENVKLLIEQKVTVSDENVGVEALHLAIKDSHFGVVQLLIAKKADFTQGFHLGTACRYNNYEIVKYLIDKKSNVMVELTAQPHYFGFQSIIQCAFENSSLQIIKLLLKSNAIIDDPRRCLEHAQERQKEVVQIMDLLPKSFL